MSVDDAVRTSLERLVRPVDDPEAVMAEVARRRDRQRRRRTTGRALAAAAAVAVLGAGVLLAATLERSGGEVAAGPGTETTLSGPPMGEVVAEQLADGSPVWVVHHEDGEVTVVDATSTHQPYGLATLIGWCATSRGFEDPQHGSSYDERGRYRGGPAPTGLAVHLASPDPAGQIVVPGRHSFEKAPRDARAAEPPDGPGCFRSEDRAGTLAPHAVGDQAVTLEEAMGSASIGEVVVVRDSPIVLRDEGAMVCWEAVAFLDDLPPDCEGVEAAGLSLADGPGWVIATGTFVGRVGDGALHDIAFVEEWIARTDGAGGWSGATIDPASAPWCLPHIRDYGIEAELVAATAGRGEFEVECWIDGPVAKAPPGGRPFDRAHVGVRSDGSAELIRAGHREDMPLPGDHGDDALPPGGPVDPQYAKYEQEPAYIGLTEAEAFRRAEQEGREPRTLWRDGRELGHNLDLVIGGGRVNLFVTDGMVIDARLF